MYAITHYFHIKGNGAKRVTRYLGVRMTEAYAVKKAEGGRIDFATELTEVGNLDPQGQDKIELMARDVDAALGGLVGGTLETYIDLGASESEARFTPYRALTLA